MGFFNNDTPNTNANPSRLQTPIPTAAKAPPTTMNSQEINPSSGINIGMAADPVSAIVGSVAGTIQAFVNADTKKQVAQLQIESQHLQLQAQESQQDVELYKVIQEKLQSNQTRLQIAAQQAKQESYKGLWIIVSILVFFLSSIYLVFKYVLAPSKNLPIAPEA